MTSRDPVQSDEALAVEALDALRPRIALGHARAGMIAALLLGAAEVVWSGQPATLATLAAGGGLCLLAGALVGGAWGFGLISLSLPPAGLGSAVWLVLVAGGAHTLNGALGVYERLEGAQAKLAWIAFAGSAAAAVGVLVLAHALQPTPGRPRGWLGALPRGPRALAVLALLAATAATFVADRLWEVGGYEPAHRALRLLALLGLAAAVHTAFGGLGRAGARSMLLLAPLVVAWIVHPFLALPGDPVLQHDVHALTLPATVVALARDATDFDGDGYSHLLDGGDCDPTDPRVHPGARDVPGNGIDENCRLGDVPPRLARSLDAPRVRGKPHHSVVLITIDSLSAGYLGAYGGDPDVTPELDRWAKKSLRFDNAFTPGGWTTLALSSLFRGVYARKLRWSRVVETNRYRMLRPHTLPEALNEGERGRRLFMLPLDDPRRTLPQWLQRRGMRTIAVVDDSYTEVLASHLGAFPGFDRYVEMPPRRGKRSSDWKVSRDAVEQIRSTKERFFLWVHFFGPHLPATRYPKFPDYGGGIAGAYKRELRYLDQQLKRLLKAIHEKKQRTPLVTIITADHGEVFLPGWRGHGRDLSEQGLRIPLLIRGPGISAGATDVPASLVDIMPTVLALTGTPGPEDMDGRDLLALVRKPEPRVLFSDTWRLELDGRRRIDLSASVDGTHKLTTDLLRMDTWHTRQDDPEERPLKDGKPPAHLKHALEQYLEHFGEIWDRDRVPAPDTTSAAP